MVTSFDAVCRMVQAGMGIGILPHKVFEIFGKPLGLASVELTDDWAKETYILYLSVMSFKSSNFTFKTIFYAST